MKSIICVLGHFGIGKNLLNGQTVKTKIVTQELQRLLGKENVLKIDTHGGWINLFKAPFQAFQALKNSKNVVIFPAHNGLRVYAPLLSVFRRFFRNRKLHYVVIGGWLPSFLKNKRWLTERLKKYDGLYVETTIMKNELEMLGFQNVYIMPNCKRLPILSREQLHYLVGVPYKLCTFSRVMKEKVIETAISVIERVNEKLGYTAYTLDIYGQVDCEQIEWFENLIKKFPSYVRYCGCVDARRSVEVLQRYFALLFPTHFYTEGIPGTIIDAYAAGVPVISAKWESFSDIIIDGKTGIGYKFDDEDEFEKILTDIASKPHILSEMKEFCISKAADYSPDIVLHTLVDNLENSV